MLGAAGVGREWFDEVESVVGGAAFGPAVRWVSSTIGAIGLLSELTDATTASPIS